MNRLILKMSVIIMVAFGCQQLQGIIEIDIYKPETLNYLRDVLNKMNSASN